MACGWPFLIPHQCISVPCPASLGDAACFFLVLHMPKPCWAPEQEPSLACLPAPVPAVGVRARLVPGSCEAEPANMASETVLIVTCLPESYFPLSLSIGLLPRQLTPPHAQSHRGSTSYSNCRLLPSSARAGIIMASNSTMDTLVERGSYGVSPLTVSTAVIGLVLFLWRFSASALDPREPPEAISKIPVIGHLIGMLKYQIHYLEILK